MKAIEMLMKEHRIIERMLGVLEAEAKAAREAGRLDAKTGQAAVSFIREYADTLHHKKEEDLLFKAMNDAGFPKEGGPIAVMLYEHDEGREMTAGMARSLEGAAKGDKKELEVFVASAFAFAGHLRQHIYKEDHILYPMSGQVLAPAAQEALLKAFEAVDAKHAETKARHEKACEELGARYGVELEESQFVPPGAGGCGMMPGGR